MRLVDRLKDGFQFPRFGMQYGSVLYAKLLILQLIVMAQSGLAFGGADNCSEEAISALPDLPLSITRVERSEDGLVRVMWPLRVGMPEDESVVVPERLQLGADFDVVRCLPPGRWIVLGRGEVTMRNGDLIEGLLNLSGQNVSLDKGVREEMVSSGNLYPAPMVGDLVVIRQKEIAQRGAITPRITLPVNELFSLSSQTSAVDLTRRGRESLREIILNSFAEARGRLLIEVHARRKGSRVKLREETSQMAKSIEQFLKYEFSLEQQQIVSIGVGADTYVPGFVAVGEPTDVVVLRVIPGQNKPF